MITRENKNSRAVAGIVESRINGITHGQLPF